MKAYKILIYTLILLLPAIIEAQEDSLFVPQDLHNALFERIEDHCAEIEEEADFSDEWEEFLLASKNKINLNDVSAEVAYTILQLSDYQYYQLLLYKEKYGELVSIYELAAIDGFDQNLAQYLAQIAEVSPTVRGGKWFANFFKRSKNTLLLRYRQIIENQAGYAHEATNQYVGSPMRLTFKYSFQSGEHFAMALAGEKDAGEAFFRGPQKQGFDHYAFFVNMKNIGIVKSCVIGDYTLGFGQGLLLGARATGVKGGGAAQVRRFPAMVRATAPMNESTNLRGVAITLGNTYYSGTLFYSHRFFDGKLIADSNGNILYSGSLTNTGFHRTANELAQRDANRNRLYGGHLQIKRRIFELGITGMNTQFATPVAPGEALYQKYAFSGKQVANASTDYKVILRKTILFGEAGVSANNERWGWGLVQGGIFDIDPRCKLALLLRYYNRDFIALNGSAFAANSSENNELGVYLAADFVIGRRTTLSLNSDIYYFPWLRFQTSQPSTGFDMGAKATVNLSRYLTLNLKYQFARKEQNQGINDYYQSTDFFDNHKIRILLNSQPTPFFKLKTEIDYLINISTGKEFQQGILFFQDADLTIEKWNLTFKARFAIFATDSYAERLYAYEQDLFSTFTINGYYGKGLRYYLMVCYGFSFFDLQARWAQTYYDDREVISSGPSQIQGRTKSELALQVIFHL